MVKKRLIPKLLIKHKYLRNKVKPLLVTTRSFDDVISVGDPISQAKIYEAQLADELVVLNIDNSGIGEDSMMLSLIEQLASQTFMPLAVGGGVRTVDDFAKLLERGADKISINTAALKTPELITEAANRYGAQCVVVSIDFRINASGNPQVIQGNNKSSTGRCLFDWAKEAVDRGAGELLLTDADLDGTGKGLNLAVGRAVASSISVPVILSGGCGLAEHFVQGFQEGLAEGVAAGTFFCFRDQNPLQIRAHIRNAGVPIRIET
ncbi:imidazole glycerol phosphate synthase cyclase subunit [Moorena sp. SIO3I6]|uniref:imidazole glycerol phosphate synthase subunit HisF n=1 Tax=Moorena sp. SIO3I6 TaxID=2607831 RepID=UPI0013F7C7EF|nr:imidazole glycerol phosphate synthase cyclase subunit [Moorena sp. SIO3I6]NEO46436.1 imidazole glycerol phosphate synthase subunit HisF [Moorena sp. SIO4A3]NEP27863.1 imidazole glycerol phosphate synthase subunit HisF [Moorena sp. SIO3I6]